jgi:hypothetical protein
VLNFSESENGVLCETEVQYHIIRLGIICARSTTGKEDLISVCVSGTAAGFNSNLLTWRRIQGVERKT